MKIDVASLTLRFYKAEGWTEEKIREYLIDKSMQITFRPDFEFPELSYWAVYGVEPNKTDQKIFRKALRENEFIFNPPASRKGEEEWYIDEGV